MGSSLGGRMLRNKNKGKRQKAKIKEGWHFSMRLAIWMMLLMAVGLAQEAKEAKTKVVETPFGPSLRAEDGKGTAKTKVVQTPFGPTLRGDAEEVKRQPVRTLKDDPMVTVEESGDTVTFKRRTPFGEQVWRKKRSELNEAEKETIAARKGPEAPPAGSPVDAGKR